MEILKIFLIGVRIAGKPLILTGQKQRIFGFFFQSVISGNPCSSPIRYVKGRVSLSLHRRFALWARLIAFPAVGSRDACRLKIFLPHARSRPGEHVQPELVHLQDFIYFSPNL